jgi:hypothetical protein
MAIEMECLKLWHHLAIVYHHGVKLTFKLLVDSFDDNLGSLEKILSDFWQINLLKHLISLLIFGLLFQVFILITLPFEHRVCAF